MIVQLSFVLPHDFVVQFVELQASKLFGSIDSNVMKIATWASTIMSPQVLINMQSSLKPAAVPANITS